MGKSIAEYDKIKSIADVIADAIKPKKIYLFGSFARGDQNSGSDYDFCAIVEDTVTDTYGLAGKAYRAIYDCDCRDVDLIVMRERNFDNRKQYPAFIENVISKEGLTIYE